MTLLRLGIVLVVLFIFIRDSSGRLITDRRYDDYKRLRMLSTQREHIQNKIVFFHNMFRTKVVPTASNMLKMKWHEGSAKAAQNWADQCMFLTHDNETGRHIDGYGACGQNIFVSTRPVAWLFAIKTWYMEKDNFTYGSTKNDLKVVGHYTQMVWATTHEVGCGIKMCTKNGGRFGNLYYNYVCNYCPIGNRKTRLGRPYKKGKPCGRCKRFCDNKQLCTNSCAFADRWANCRQLHKVYPAWLCNTETPEGKERMTSCRATCTCKRKIYD